MGRGGERGGPSLGPSKKTRDFPSAVASGVDQAYQVLPTSPEPLAEGSVSGFASILYTNAWAMNYPLWSLDADFKFRFKVRLVSA